MRTIVTGALVAVFSFSQAQDVQQEINTQVWVPFTRALMSQDADAFLRVHSANVMRVERNAKRVLSFTDYKNELLAQWPQWKENNKARQVEYTFELRFLERHATASQAYEVGYFRNHFRSGTNEHVSYGKFHVALQKENGIWKILVDSDSDEGGTITEEMFQSAKPMQ